MQKQKIKNNEVMLMETSFKPNTNLIIEIDDEILYLKGSLNYNNLDMIWNKNNDLLISLKNIDVSKLIHADSAGLALLVYLCIHYQAKLINIPKQLNTLITLYGLDKIVE